MDSALFDYELPEHCIASTPAARRDESRLLVVERDTGKISHRVFRDLPKLLPAGTELFRNNARVLRARLPGVRPSGGRVECLLLRPATTPEEGWCLLKPGKKAADAAGFGLENFYRARVVEQRDAEYRVRFELPAGKTVLTVSEEIGALPLPPYIEKSRDAGTDFSALDRERYQTIYAESRRAVAAAAPTAGLHFSPEVLEKLAAEKIPAHDLTLHVGLGTFQPIKAEKIEEHVIHREFYEIPPATLSALQTCRQRLAVGTTALRAMEDFARKLSRGAHASRVQRSASCRTHLHPEDINVAGEDVGNGTQDACPPRDSFSAEADIFIYPPERITGAEILLTNFHLPRSTLMCLVSSFLAPGSLAGIAQLKEIYADAIARGYRFYSYGDAMLIL